MPCIRSIGREDRRAPGRARSSPGSASASSPTAPPCRPPSSGGSPPSRSAGSCRSVPSCTITAPTALPPSAEATCDCLALRPTGTIATSGASGQGVELEQVGAHRAAAHRQHDVVHRGAGRLADRPQPLDRPVLRGEAARAGDVLVERSSAARRATARRSRCAGCLLSGPDQRAGHAGGLGGDAERRAQRGDRQVRQRRAPRSVVLLARRALRPHRPTAARHVALVGVGRQHAARAAASPRRRRPARGGSWCTSRPGRRAGPR